jgi:plasmid stability protein
VAGLVIEDAIGRLNMVDILVRNVEEDVARRLKKAAAAGTSLNEVAREALRKDVKPSKAEVLAEMDRIRAMSPYSPVDSTALIREDRDNDEPYR